MLLSVVILTCNQWRLTERCLESLLPLCYRGDCEIILVDNGSEDATKSRLQDAKYERIRALFLGENKGVARGRNAGMKIAGGKYCMFLDNDTIAAPSTLLAMLDYMQAHPQVGVLAPRLVSPAGLTQRSFKDYPSLSVKVRNFLSSKGSTSIVKEEPQKPFEPFYVIGAAQMFLREDFEKAGGLDEKIFFGPEDADFCMALRKQGKQVLYNPEFTIIHDWQRATTSRPFSRATRLHIKALMHFWWKHRRLF